MRSISSISIPDKQILPHKTSIMSLDLDLLNKMRKYSSLERNDLVVDNRSNFKTPSRIHQS